MAWKHRTVKQEWEVVTLSRDRCQREIAELTGLHKTVVLDVQRKYHLTLSFGQSASSASFRYKYDEYEWGRAIERLYVQERRSLEDTARALGVGVDTVVRRMDRLHIPRRTSGESNRGKKRRPYRTREAQPLCEAGCGTRVRTAGEAYCATCRKSPKYRSA